MRSEILSFAIVLAGALLTAGSIPSSAAEPVSAGLGLRETHQYDLDFSIEVEGRFRFVVPTYFYRFQDLSLIFDAAPQGDGYRYVARSLRASPASPIYGIGEGPFKLQHYILLPQAADTTTIARFEEKVVRLENQSEEVRRLRGTFHRSKKKDSHVNLYRVGATLEGFTFDLGPSGNVQSVNNRAGLEEVRVTGGDHAAPHFFDLLACSLRCIPSASIPCSVPGLQDERASWTISCGPVIERLVDLAGQVYGLPMKMQGAEPGGEDIGYEAFQEPGTDRVYITGRLLRKRPFRMSVRGFDGRIWLDGFCRVLCTDARTGRILKDDLWLSFGTERRGMIVSLKEVTSRFHYRLSEADFPEMQPPTIACSGFSLPAAP